jgi:hypothetical protein
MNKAMAKHYDGIQHPAKSNIVVYSASGKVCFFFCCCVV